MRDENAPRQAGPGCMHAGCGHLASHRLVFELRAFENCPPAEAEAGLLVCGEHATQEDADDVLSFGWESLVDMFGAVGRAAPDPDCSTATWKRLDA